MLKKEEKVRRLKKCIEEVVDPILKEELELEKDEIEKGIGF